MLSIPLNGWIYEVYYYENWVWICKITLEISLMTPNCTSTISFSRLGTRGRWSNSTDCTWMDRGSIKHQGASTVFADIDKKIVYFNWKLQKNILKKTKAVIVVNLYGNMSDHTEILLYVKETIFIW